MSNSTALTPDLNKNNLKTDRQFLVLTNPGQKYWEQFVKLVVLNEGWINSVHDYKTLLDGFPDGNFKFLVAVDKNTRDFIGGVCVATYAKPEPLSAIAMFYVLPSYQGKGIGIYLFDEAVKLCAPRKFLFGVSKMMAKYRDRYGFNKFTDWQVVTARMESQKVKPLQLNHDPTLTMKTPEECGWDNIVKYYQKFLPYFDTSALIKALLTEPRAHCRVALTSDNQIAALVRIRETYNSGLSIGPLLGDNSAAACTVLQHVLCQIQNLHEFKSVIIQFPNTNQDTHNFLQKMTDGDYKVDGITYPQFTNQVLEVPVSQIFAISQDDVVLV